VIPFSLSFSANSVAVLNLSNRLACSSEILKNESVSFSANSVAVLNLSNRLACSSGTPKVSGF
jgi:hypothetical protein